jgi:O-antigen/teichoic acid export membrane protein
VSLGTLLLTIPLALDYLGPARYGVVATITALTSMLVFADFGLGNGLMNLVAGAAGRANEAAARRSISSAFFMLTAIALALAVPFVLLYRFVPWVEFMGVHGQRESAEVSAAIAVFLASVLINLPLGIVHRVQLALQQGFVNNLWNGVGSLAALLGVFLAVRLDAGLPWIVAALVGAPIVSNSLNWLSLFVVRSPHLRPRWVHASIAEGRQLARIGSLFFVLQLAVAFAYQSDVVVATAVIGPEGATTYTVPFRLFMIAPTIVSMVLLPLWPAYSEAIARGDISWVKRTLRLSLIVSLILTGTASIVLVIIGPVLIHAWVGGSVTTTFPLLLGMGTWAVLNNASTAVSMLLNGASVIRFQVFTALAMALSSPVASILLGMNFGVAGIIWGTVLAHLLCSGIPTLLFLPGFLRGLRKVGATSSQPADRQPLGAA